MVDELLDAVERGATGDGRRERRRAGVRARRMAVEDRDTLVGKLDEYGVAHRWEGESTLVVRPGDEATSRCCSTGWSSPTPCPSSRWPEEDEAVVPPRRRRSRCCRRCSSPPTG
jgi:hypothetical protein